MQASCFCKLLVASKWPAGLQWRGFASLSCVLLVLHRYMLLYTYARGLEHSPLLSQGNPGPRPHS